jgi:tetratricopeptide (TPR) repeat protein
MRRHATEVLAVAGHLGRTDLETEAMSWLGAAEGSAGNVASSIELHQRAIGRARALGIPPPPVAGHYECTGLYWVGRLDEAVESARAAVAMAQAANNLSWTLLSLPHLGAALASSGRYAEAIQVFAETRQLGCDYGVENLVARSIAWSTGFHLDLFDDAGAEALAREARDLARSANFAPAAISASIDLLRIYARRQEVDQTGPLLDEVTAVAAQTAGFHGWLWQIRLAQARAEIALARGDWDEALRCAADAIAQSHARGRVKYEVLGLTTRAQAMVAIGRAQDAIADLQTALALARPVGDPALLLRAAATRLALDGSEALAAEARASVERITANLPDAELRRRFEQAEPVRLLAKLTSPGLQ